VSRGTEVQVLASIIGPRHVILVDSDESAELTFKVLEGDMPDVGDHVALTIGIF
jgi:hypothetical protein